MDKKSSIDIDDEIDFNVNSLKIQINTQKK